MRVFGIWCILLACMLSASCSDGSLREQEAATLIFRELTRSEGDRCTRPHILRTGAWMGQQANNGNPHAFRAVTQYMRSGALELAANNGMTVDLEGFDGGAVFGQGAILRCVGAGCTQHLGRANIVLRSSSLELCLDYLAGPQNITVERIEFRDERHARAYFSMQGEYTSLFEHYEREIMSSADCASGDCIRFRGAMVVIPCVGPQGNNAFTGPFARSRMDQVDHLGYFLWSMDMRGEQCFADFRRTVGVWSLRRTHTPYFALP